MQKSKAKSLGIMGLVAGLFAQSSVIDGPGKEPEHMSYKQGAARFHFGVEKPTEREMEVKREHVLLMDKGLSTFIYDVDGEAKSVIALNQKNADKKARKHGWIV